MLASSLRAAGRSPGQRSARVTMIGRTLALVTERVDPSQQRRSLEAGAVSELQGIARFKMPSAHLLSMSDLARAGQSLYVRPQRRTCDGETTQAKCGPKAACPIG